MGHPLLGYRPSRKFKIYREEYPAIFRFDGKLFQESQNIDTNEIKFVEILPEMAERWLSERKV